MRGPAGCPVATDDVERDLAQQRQVACSRAVAHAAVVLAKRHIQHPMQGIFHGPMRADGLAQDGRTVGTARQEVADLALHFCGRAVDAADALDRQVRRPGQPLRAPRVAASVLANTRRRTRRPCVSSKASQSARLGAPTWKQCWSKCSTTAAWARGWLPLSVSR